MYPESQYIFLCPALMEHQWGRILSRVAGTHFVFKWNSCLWNKDLHKPPMIAFITPLFFSVPWKLSQHTRLVEWEHKLLKMQHSHTKDVRDYMREFWMSG